MRTFLLIWLAQLISTIGSRMSNFALVLWAWNLTGSPTTLTLVAFFSQLPRIPITLFAGIVVDRHSRKQLMLLADSIAALSTLSIALLYLTDILQIWHLYLAAALNGGFGQIQNLAYRASVSLLVPKTQLTRANSLSISVGYGSNILGPALAGALYPLIGLLGILWLDLATFGGAIALLIFSPIPHLPSQTKNNNKPTPLLSQLTFGFRYIWQKTGLRSLLLITTFFWFFHDLGEAIYIPMILARTNGNAQVLASTATAAGIGGVTSAIALTVWGGPKRRIHGMLNGFIGAGIAKTIFGFGQTLRTWFPAQFCSSLNFPLLGSSEKALWMESTTPEIQGRIFAANSFVLQVVSAIATLIAGPLAEHIFEPAVRSSTVAWVVRPLFGTEPGAGIALLYVLTSLALILVGVGGFYLPALRRADETISVAK